MIEITLAELLAANEPSLEDAAQAIESSRVAGLPKIVLPKSETESAAEPEPPTDEAPRSG